MRQIIDKYSEELPEELLLMLRDKDDYIENCNSHYVRGNYIDCPNNMVLDLNYNKEKRLEYYNALDKAHTTGDYTDFVKLVNELEIEMLNK